MVQAVVALVVGKAQTEPQALLTQVVVVVVLVVRPVSLMEVVLVLVAQGL